MYQWLPEALRSWFLPPPSCPPDKEPSSLPRPRKRRRRRRSIQSSLEDLEQEQTKRQKLGIFGTLTKGIASLITLPSQLAAKYLQTEDQHAEVKDEPFSNASNGTLSDKQMEPTPGKQMCKLYKKTGCGTSMHPDVEVVSDYHKVMPCLRYDCSTGKNSKRSHSLFQEDLLQWGLATHQHKLEDSSLDAGRYLRKPHYTVEEASAETFQNEEREKYKMLLEQEKEKGSKNNSRPITAKHLDMHSHTRGSISGMDVPSFETPRNGVRNIGLLCSNRNANSLATSERSSELDKIVVQKKKDMEREIANVLSYGQEDEILTSAFKLNITRGDIQTLRNQHWLNDVARSVKLLKKKKPLMSYRLESMLGVRPTKTTLFTVSGLAKEKNPSAPEAASAVLVWLPWVFKEDIVQVVIGHEKARASERDAAAGAVPVPGSPPLLVINFYMNLLVERNKRQGLPVLYAFSTFFYPKLNTAGYNAVIDMRRETIKYFDSMGQNGHKICMKLQQYLQDESKAKRNVDINASSWTLYSMKPHEIPQQLNGSDCGMFTCKYADFISRDKPIVFTQCHMPYYRKRMVWEILHQHLL
ncbi:hypothetical protein JD844_007118 [Phrynosoma platyrhinos]|uniref:Ubiquitin-like protease family profile domain-containing protein n=1 Tax=Phrynosoma platyrhinos TaxID=52577 RepID=A0ABQ7T2Q6_PHRPL|nr:hypothetical protein JD844_007118 [Phrynosoma platyrhinos]